MQVGASRQFEPGCRNAILHGFVSFNHHVFFPTQIQIISYSGYKNIFYCYSLVVLTMWPPSAAICLIVDWWTPRCFQSTNAQCMPFFFFLEWSRLFFFFKVGSLNINEFNNNMKHIIWATHTSHLQELLAMETNPCHGAPGALVVWWC